MINMLVHHAVKDFSKWRPAFDADAAARQAAGLREINVWRNADEPQEVVLLFEVLDVAKAKAFAASTDLKDRMVASGVIGRPEITFLTQS